ncbi:MAG: ATP-binding protein [Pseudomonadota bacterium]
MTESRHKKLHTLIIENEECLMASILHHAIKRGYAAYTSTLVEPWRLSICGLSQPLLAALAEKRDSLELAPDEDYTLDAIAAFGILEAKRHRQRGISIAMFMGLFKYYRQSYTDLLDKGSFTAEETIWAANYLHRFFDRIELGLCSEWTKGTDAEKITELQAANRNMTNEKNKYLTLFESLSQPVILLDVNGVLDRINQAAAQWLEVSDNRFYTIESDIDTINKALQGKRYDAIFPWLQGIVEKLDQEQKVITEHHTLTSKDKRLEINVQCSAMCDISRKFNGFILVFSDRTHEYKLISELQTMHVQLLQASKLESIGQLAAGIAHEINTPSQFVSSNISFLSEAFTDISTFIAAISEATHKEDISFQKCQSILEDADWPYLKAEIPLAFQQSQDGMARITSIVQAMKEFSHPGNKKLEPTDINHLIELTTTIAGNEWKNAADIATDFDPDLPLAPCLSDEMGQVILNILVNAAHAITEKLGDNPEGRKGRITIVTRQVEDCVELRISDTGTGIPEKNRGRVFDPFFTTKQVGKGTGQGLAIAHDIITGKHQGTIAIESEIGIGSTFIIRLPIVIGNSNRQQ